MDMSTNESLGDPASILASIASIAEDLAEQQPVSTESREVVNDVNRQALQIALPRAASPLPPTF